MSEQHTPGPWARRSIPGHLFEIHNSAGEVVLRIRGGMMPSLGDARLLEAAPDAYTLAEGFAAEVEELLSACLIEPGRATILNNLMANWHDLRERVQPDPPPDPVRPVQPVRTVQPVQRGCPECGFHGGAHEVFCSQGRD